MDWLTFFTKLAAAFAWPACVLTIAGLYRRKISDLLDRITRGKFPGGEFEFSENALRQLEYEKANAGVLESEIDEGESSGRDYYSLEAAWNLLSVLPRAAVLEAWRVLENAARDRLDHENEESCGSDSGSGSRYKSISALMLGEALEQRGIFSERHNLLFNELRTLRNTAAHENAGDESSITDEAGLEYLRLVRFLLNLVDPMQI